MPLIHGSAVSSPSSIPVCILHGPRAESNTFTRCLTDSEWLKDAHCEQITNHLNNNKSESVKKFLSVCGGGAWWALICFSIWETGNQSSMSLGQKIMDQGSSTKNDWRMWGQRKISCMLQSSQIILGWEHERLRAQVEWSQTWLDRKYTGKRLY